MTHQYLVFKELFLEPQRNGLTRPKSVRGNGIKMVNMGEVFAHSRIDNIEMERVPFSDKERESFLLQPFDLLFARQSLIASGAGKCTIVLRIIEDTTWESHIIRIRLNNKIADPLFYYYYFNSRMGRQNIETIVEQVAAAGIRGSDLAQLKVPYPPLAEQKAIAHVLGSLDDKIELNRQTNQTLEEMARMLFKEWFIDFGPVRAKMRGEQPIGLSAELASLFPDRLDNEAKPEGWEFKTISTMIEIIGGGTPKTTNPDYWDGSIPWFSIVDAPASSDVFVIDTQKKITELGLMSSSARLLKAGSTIITARGTVGKLALLATDMTMNQSCYGIADKCGYGDYYTYFLLKKSIQQLQANVHGSVFDTITRQTFDNILVIDPSKELAVTFNNLVAPILDKIKQNLLESSTLAQMRDLLLPKLLSGQMRVQEAEIMLEQVV